MLDGKHIWVRPLREIGLNSRDALSVCTLGLVLSCALPEMHMVGGNGGSTGSNGDTGASKSVGVGGTLGNSNAKSSVGEGFAGASTQSIGIAGTAGSTAQPINAMTGGTPATVTSPSSGIPYVPANAPSCDGLGKICQNESCCTSIRLPGGTYPMGRSIQQSASDYYDKGAFDIETPEHSATVASFALDKYEVTVGRFRRFVNAYDEWHKANPSEGAGAHPIAERTGWGQSWSAAIGDLPANKTELTNALKFNEAYQTWTDETGTNEAYPINCVDWFTAFAFCIWDGGRLPTEAEWEYAAAAGSQNRLYPWGKEAPDFNRANYDFGEGSPASTSRIEVGSKLATGGAGYFNHADLAGSVSEWIFDWFLGNYYGTDEVPVPCGNCANVTPTGGPAGDPPTRVIRSGSWYGDSNITGFHLRAASRSLAKPTHRENGLGFRCARMLP